MLKRLKPSQLLKICLSRFSQRENSQQFSSADQSQQVNLEDEMERNRKFQEVVDEMFAEINTFQNLVFSQPEMDFLLRNMHVKDALAVACYFKLGFMTNAKNEDLAQDIVERIRNFDSVNDCLACRRRF